MIPDDLSKIVTNLTETELIEITRAIEAGHGAWTNYGLYEGAGYAEFLWRGQRYEVLENYETVYSIRRM